MEAASLTCAGIGLVDGELVQALAVTPAEVRAAARRVPVLGAASLGALRAVEVPEVWGIGEIFEAFRDGRLADDDELVGTWNPDGGAVVAWPLVIAREALADDRAAARAVAAMKEVPFHERTRTRLVQLVREAGGDGEAFSRRLQAEPNVKQRDALRLVRALGEVASRLGLD